MSMLSDSIFVPIFSAFLGSVAAILARTLLKNTPAKRMLSINFLMMAAILFVLSPLFYSFKFTVVTVELLAAIAVIDTLANFFYFKTFEKTEATTAIPILSLAPVVTFLASAFFLNERPGAKTVSLALIILGLVIFVSTDWKNIRQFKTNTLFPAIMSSLLFGISAIPSKYLLSTLHGTNAPTLYMFRAALIGFFSLFVFKNRVTDLNFKTYQVIFIRSLFVIGQWILLYYAMTLGSTGVAVTLGNITPIFVLLIGYLFLKEKIDWKKGLAALAILLLSLMVK